MRGVPKRRLESRSVHFIFDFWMCVLAAGMAAAQNPPPPAPSPSSGPTNGAAQSTAPPTVSSDPSKPNDSNAAEVTTHDTAPTFKVRVNEVLVRVVVRDESGRIVSNLKKEDFQLF